MEQPAAWPWEGELLELRRYAVRVACRFGASESDAEDLAQDVLLKLWLAGDHVAKPRAWVRTVVRHELAKVHRRRNALSVDAAPKTHSNLEKLAVARLALSEYLGQLPARQRQAVVLRAEGFSQREIAARLGSTPRAVERVIARARRTLRKLRACQ